MAIIAKRRSSNGRLQQIRPYLDEWIRRNGGMLILSHHLWQRAATPKFCTGTASRPMGRHKRDTGKCSIKSENPKKTVTSHDHQKLPTIDINTQTLTQPTSTSGFVQNSAHPNSMVWLGLIFIVRMKPAPNQHRYYDCHDYLFSLPI